MALGELHGPPAIPIPCPSHQRCPEPFSRRPCRPASRSILWHLAHIGASPLRQEFLSFGGPSMTVAANTPTARRGQNAQLTTQPGYVDSRGKAQWVMTLRQISEV